MVRPFVMDKPPTSICLPPPVKRPVPGVVPQSVGIVTVTSAVWPGPTLSPQLPIAAASTVTEPVSWVDCDPENVFGGFDAKVNGFESTVIPLKRISICELEPAIVCKSQDVAV